MQRLFRALVSESVVIGVILTSTLALFAYGFTAPGTLEHGVWLAIDVGCVGYFVLEAVIKIRLDGWQHYLTQPWNRFDLIVVILSLPVLVAPITTDTIAFIGVPVLRLARLFRLFRLLRFIPDHDRLGAGVVRAMRASVGVFLAIAIVNFIFAMGAHVMFDRLAPDYFGNPGRACYSMFRIFTIEGWNDIPDAIAVNASYAMTVFARIYFGVAVLVGGILGLSMGNAVFVDQMMVDNTDMVEADIVTLTTEVRALRDEIRALRAAVDAATVPPPA
jgi:voltage-gated sodium channel